MLTSRAGENPLGIIILNYTIAYLLFLDRTVLEPLLLSLLRFSRFWLDLLMSCNLVVNIGFVFNTLLNELSPAQHMLVYCINFVPNSVIDLTFCC